MVKYLRMYAARAGYRKYVGKAWQYYLGKRIWAYNASSKCLGGE